MTNMNEQDLATNDQVASGSTNGPSTIPQQQQQQQQQHPEGGVATEVQNTQNVPPSQPRVQLTEEEAAAFAKARADNAKAVQDSREGVWYLKEIAYEGGRKKIITQNYNGYVIFSD